jgi:hypothetical protein
MAKQTINIGSAPNAGNGDPLRTAFDKINDNFDELYTAVAANTANTGDITFDGVKIIGAGTASGDGNEYSTLELVPDNTLYENDQYIVIDPTAPNHVHIRAGGTQDDSAAELYLGGEVNYVRVTDNGGVRVQNQTRNSSTYYYSDPETFTTATWYENNGTYFVQYTTSDAELADITFDFNNDDENTLLVYYNGGANSATLTSAGSISNLGGGVYRVTVNEAPPSSPTVIGDLEYTIWNTRTNSVQLSDNDFTVFVYDDIRITGRDTFSLRNEGPDASISIRTDYDGADHAWDFDANGDLHLPNSGDIIFSSGGESGRIIPMVSDGGGLQIQAELDFEIKVNDGQGGNAIWSFAGSDITFPDNSIQTGASISISDLKLLVANTSTYDDFKTAIANL